MACTTAIFLFSDSAWLGATRQLAERLLAFGACVELTVWAAEWRVANGTLSWCKAERGCRFTRRSETSGWNAASRWGSDSYFATINQRLLIVNATLADLDRRLSHVRMFGILDSDIVLYRNPLRRAERLFDAKQAVAFIFQQEWPCATHPHYACVNGGAWLARNEPRTRRLLGDAISLMRRLSLPDQDAWQLIAQRHVHEFDFWPRHTHPNGRLMLALPRRARVCERMHLVHANWLRTRQCKLIALDSLWRCQSPLTTLPPHCPL